MLLLTPGFAGDCTGEFLALFGPPEPKPKTPAPSRSEHQILPVSRIYKYTGTQKLGLNGDSGKITQSPKIKKIAY